MNLLFRKLFGLATPQQSAFGPSTSRNYPASTLGGSESTVRVQLVNIVMRDLLRKSGIPPGWLTCQPQVVNSKSRGMGIFVRLSVKHWDDRLMQHAFAFQKALLHDIVHFEPKAVIWLQGIAWQLEVASTCPHTELPDRDFWLEAPVTDAARPTWPASPHPDVLPHSPPAPVAGQAPTAVAMLAAAPSLASTAEAIETPELDSDTAQDLQRLFAVRDNALAQQSANPLLPAGYESTEPAALRHQ